MVAFLAAISCFWCLMVARGTVARSIAPTALVPVGRSAMRVMAPIFRGWERGSRVYRERRARARYTDQLPELIDLIVRQLRAGASLLEGLRAVGQQHHSMLHQDVDTIVNYVDQGQEFSDAIESWRCRCQDYSGRESLDVVCALLVLAHRTGGASAAAFDRVATTLRSRRDVQREARALAAQATASSMLMVVAPIGYVAFGVATQNSSAAFLFGTPIGLACLGGGVVLDVTSALWMRSIIRSVV